MQRTLVTPPRLRAAAAGGLALHLLHAATGFGGATIDWLVVQALYNLLLGVAAVVCLARAVRTPEERAGWGLLGVAIVAWLLGEIAWSAGLGNEEGRFSICDVGYFAFYPLALAGCTALAHGWVGRRPLGTWLDALAAVLAVGAAGTAFLLADVFSGSDTNGSTALTALGYPVLDVMLVAVVLGLAAGQGWRLDRRWTVLGVGLLVSGIADGVYFAQITAGTYVEGGLLDSLWPASMLLVAQAATMPRDERRLTHTPTLALPLLLAVLALSVLVVDHFSPGPTVAVVLACAALVAVLWRALLAFTENGLLLAHSRDEAVTDGLTGLPNRRALSRALDDTLLTRRPTTLLLFDLDGFKLYNDTFGHPAGDALLIRLGGRLLEAVDGAGTAYRMGGDEFCVLLDGDGASSARVELALRERGDGFDVGASHGAVALPREAGDAIDAMRIADHRLYAGKEQRRASAGAQATDALLKVLGEREPDLHEHLHHVARLAVAVADALGLAPQEVDETRRAAELHDIGKVALPDLILHKPGPLSAEEREFVEQHTVIGERILAAAPALRAVGRIVRASHEHWDGGGYPDGLAAEQIPIGARIIAACDAYDAMTSERPYEGPIPPEAALAELRRCAGTQFDPAVVTAFIATVEPALGGPNRALSSSAPAGRLPGPLG